ncbi:MAG: UDP-2,3-diacylglucosamine diphosphatase [Bacteroidales bacterium]|nr:UDP-2,3-diacylglucosamine diphosphatase [Bacteroidales bacterium]
MKENKKIYFASDFHLGVPDYESSLEREKLIVKWLDEIKQDAEELFLLGDVFDFWFEYKSVVPRGFVRLLGKIAELSDSGIKIHYFTGNHDIWIYDYLPKELNAELYHHPIIREINGKKFYIAHGDGLGPSDYKFKLMKKGFRSSVLQWIFSALLHPNFAFKIAKFFSLKSRFANDNNFEKSKFLGEKEWLIINSRKILEKEHIDFFIYGHRHFPVELQLSDKSKYINLGEWVNYKPYAVFDGNNTVLKQF